MGSTFTSPNAQYFGEFGQSVSTNGKTVAVGAPFETANGQQLAGHVYAFNAATGGLIMILTSPKAEPSGFFGFSVAISNNIIAVGAYGEAVRGQSGAGRVYAFNAKTGALISTLTSPEVSAGEFGYSVSVSGTTVAVGAPSESAKAKFSAGHAYTFNAETGGLLNTLTSPNSQLFGEFGFSVDISGNVLAVGAPFESGNGYGAGKVYTFDNGTGNLTNTLRSPDEQVAGRFGSSVAVNNNIVAVGAPFESANVPFGANAGRAYVFNAQTGSLIVVLTSPNVQGNGYFGFSIAVGGNMVVVGAPFESTNGEEDGRAYSFNTRTGMTVGMFTSPNPEFLGGFGTSVAAGGDILAVSAIGETVDGQSFAGNVYTF